MVKDELNKIIGLRIKSLRESKDMSQKSLADALFKERQTVQRIEAGGTNPTIFTLYQISKVLEISLHELVKIDELTGK
ncbi:helix-turn-helix domain-containing protein [Marinifilum flexuosum]|uniref:helix-turn-helix domain-containing protein n=1 Tax=Marinifilum flexuosum TaxID=1117708 RepID=UPI002492E8A0|nr:helix-turn-helix transcriptional regulator [Marinifilum flexuosum]